LRKTDKTCFATWPGGGFENARCNACEVVDACEQHYVWRTEPPNPQSPDPVDAVVVVEENEEEVCEKNAKKAEEVVRRLLAPKGCVIIVQERDENPKGFAVENEIEGVVEEEDGHPRCYGSYGGFRACFGDVMARCASADERLLASREDHG